MHVEKKQSFGKSHTRTPHPPRWWTVPNYLTVCVSINQELCYSLVIYGPTAFASTPKCSRFRLLIWLKPLFRQESFFYVSNFPEKTFMYAQTILRRTIYCWFPGIHWDTQLKHGLTTWPHSSFLTCREQFSINHYLNLYIYIWVPLFLLTFWKIQVPWVSGVDRLYRYQI